MTGERKSDVIRTGNETAVLRSPNARRLSAAVLLGAAALLGFGSWYAAPTSPHERAMNSVCKLVTGPESGGTGFVFYEDEQNLWVFTAGHLVYRTTECDLYFYMTHEPTGPIRGRVVAVGYNHAEETADPEVIDVALVRVSKQEFGDGPLPPTARLAPLGTQVKLQEPIFSVGCPNLTWPTAWFGRVAFLNERSFWFEPNPLPGRSGSPIFNHDGQYVVGLIVWNGPLQGRAISSEALYQFLYSRNLMELTRPPKPRTPDAAV